METRLEEPIEPSGPAEPPDWFGFWLGWVALTSVGWIAGLVPGSALMAGFESVLPAGNPLPESLVHPVAGLTAGILQGVLLRRRGLPFGRWVSACAVAWTLSVVVVAAESPRHLPQYVPWWLDRYLTWSVVGAMVAATQWLVLRRRASRAWAWILAGAAGWGLARELFEVGGDLFLGWDDVRGCLLLFAGLAAVGPLTGAAALLCLRRLPPHLAGGRRALWLVGALWLVLVTGSVAALCS